MAVANTKAVRMTTVLNKLGLTGSVMTYGNAKLPKTTLIFNHSCATECPSMEFCPYVKQCYARRDERLYKAYKARNMRNRDWFKTASIEDIKELFSLYIREASKNYPIKNVRLNEAGDFESQEAIEKFNIISTWLKETYNISVYAYSCREDLDFSGRTFILNSSSDKLNSYDRRFKCTPKKEYALLSKKDVKCYGDCRICRICSQSKYKGIIYCEEH